MSRRRDELRSSLGVRGSPDGAEGQATPSSDDVPRVAFGNSLVRETSVTSPQRVRQIKSLPQTPRRQFIMSNSRSKLINFWQFSKLRLPEIYQSRSRVERLLLEGWFLDSKVGKGSSIDVPSMIPAYRYDEILSVG